MGGLSISFRLIPSFPHASLVLPVPYLFLLGSAKGDIARALSPHGAEP